MPRYDWNYMQEKARPVKGGIKAQSERGAMVKNWWAKRWLTALETFLSSGRLARGRNYARKGQVINLEIAEGNVSAVVQGSMPQPYEVKIQVKQIPEEKWNRMAGTAFAQPAIAAKLISGEMPENIDKTFAQNKLSLFPSTENDLKTFCSCPDQSNPCKHIAAVYYLLSEEFDRDPFLIFTMRGMSRERLLNLLSGVSQTEVEPVKRGRAPKSKTKTASDKNKVSLATATTDSAGQTKPLPTDATLFWGQQPIKFDFAGAVRSPAQHAVLPRRLGNLPFWRSHRNFMSEMDSIYAAASQSAIELLLNLKGKSTPMDSEFDSE